MTTKISNSAVATTLFTASGAAISDSSQPTLDKTSASGPGTSSSDNAVFRQATKIETSDINQSIAQVYNGTLIGTVSSLGANGQNTVVTFGSSHNAAIGDFILFNKSGNLGKVTRILSDTALDVNIPQSTASANIGTGAGSESYLLGKDAFKDRDYQVLFTSSNVLAGEANKAIEGGSTTPNRDVNNSESIRTVMTASGIRAGNWNEYSGSWTVEPIERDDTSIVNPATDTAFSGNGFVNYQFGSNVPTGVSY